MGLSEYDGQREEFQEILRLRTRHEWKICIIKVFLQTFLSPSTRSLELQTGCIQHRCSITSSHQCVPLDTLMIDITIHTPHWFF